MTAGLIWTGQPDCAALSARALRRLLSDSGWRRIFRAVYATPAADLPEPELRRRAALLPHHDDPDVALAAESALVPYELLDDFPKRLDVHLGVRRSREFRAQRGLVPHRRRADAGPSRIVEGYRVVPAEEAVVLAWPRLTERECRAAISLAVGRRHSTVARLRREARAQGCFKGRARFWELLDLVADGCHSPIEVDFVLDVERPYGLPPAKRQARLSRPGRNAYGDLWYDWVRTLFELDGRDDHGDDDDRRADLRRDAELAVDGVLTGRITGRQIRREPEWVARTVLGTIAAREQQLGTVHLRPSPGSKSTLGDVRRPDTPGKRSKSRLAPGSVAAYTERREGIRMSVHQCPECELRFADQPELVDHIRTDHPNTIGEPMPHPGLHSNWPREPHRGDATT